jgi:hypothetical protein
VAPGGRDAEHCGRRVSADSGLAPTGRIVYEWIGETRADGSWPPWLPVTLLDVLAVCAGLHVEVVGCGDG